MKTSRQDWRRAIDFSAVNDENAICNVIAGLLSRRSNPMREKEIAQWFYATPKSVISAALATMLDRGQIHAGGTSLNRNRRVLAYWTVNRDE